ncbi:chromosome partitioning protein ParB [Aeromicrobium sp. 636]|uniref:Chromosome partitioning protein ParB n=1 Tax=Aeromicrobium senzhongii TaxID=2663859 RepID=A0A8I0ETI0_9ACTN|nr:MULTISPECIES: chromosome partitioning protein ParB [Aeromicrobium]MBC9225900.1 chromosome partitioning protein ParB [Aeromicrobium senzhongii]MCQ3998007.1 chromosome partitioning protein ParB [Aeromicrobium sp. 636]MTB87923.1 chromosome partitioning protein ParB [Aeromicrobium senzhongii]QNL95058.1 chromosome partitioning protein ParB [Aeromicrobium senzhongii]
MADSGSPRIDAESDFLRSRRLQTLSSLAAMLRGDRDTTKALSFDEVADALGRRGERRVGLQLIPLDAIIGSVDKVRDFDRRFRPTSDRSRARWERIARASRIGEEIPPIDVYKLGDYYFVRDGHHRVSVARALHLRLIEAEVTEVQTLLEPRDIGRRTDLEMKHWRKLFLQRVPLEPRIRGAVTVTDPFAYGLLAEMVEAWGARCMQAEGQFMDKQTMARRWLDEEFLPVLQLVADAGLKGEDETDADAYIRIAGERYRLIGEHLWDRDIMAEVAKRRGRRSSRRRT